MIYSAPPSEVCLETWLTCENVLADISNTNFVERQKMRTVFSECADICLGMIQAIKTQSENADKIALLCVGICEECAEICDKYLFHPLYSKCAMVCRKCANSLSYLALASLAS